MRYTLHEVVVELTEQCNLNCIHCGSACEATPPQDELTADEWNGVFDQLEAMGVRKVVCSGGEPTIKKHVERIIRHLGKKSFDFGLITNGLRLTPSLRDALSDAQPFSVGVSLDGLKQAHNKIRQHTKSFSGVMHTISALQDVDLPVCVVTTLHQLNFRDLHRMATFLSAVEVSAWQLQLAMSSGRMRSQQNLLLSEKQFQQVSRDIISLREEYPRLRIEAADCFGPAPPDMIRKGEWWGCTAGLCSAGIDAYGNVMPCLSLRIEQRCGNVRDMDISTIWQNSRGFDFNRRFDVEHIGSRCKGCDFNTICRGGCASTSMADCGSFHNAPYCFVRSLTENV